MEQSPFVEVGLPVALFIIMVGIGLTLRLADFRREARSPRGTIVGSVGGLLVVPALAFAIAWALRLPPELAIGLVIVAACPGGTTSNLITHLARANVALSIVLTVVASLVTIVTLPLLANLAASTQPIADLGAIEVPLGRTIGLMVGVVLVPVGIGMALRARSATLAMRLEGPLSAFGALVLVVMIVGIAIGLRDQLWELLVSSGPAVILLLLAAIAAGFVIAGLAGLGPSDRLTIAIEMAVKNSTLGILIAVTVIGNETVAVPAAVFGLLMYATGAALIAWGRRTAERHEPTPGAASV